jgi:hypothetical protein
MKRIIIIAVLLISALSLWAADKPRRYIEFGIDANGSFANNYLGVGDILQDTIVVDFTTIADDLKKGMDLYFDAGGGFFFNVNLRPTWGFGIFSKLDAVGEFNLPNSLIDLLSRGNKLDKTYSGDFGLGAAAFAEFGFWSSFNVKALKITLQPAYYMPVLYLHSPKVNYSLTTDSSNGTINLNGNYAVDVYTPISLDDTSNIDPVGILKEGGVDLTLRGEYPLFKFLTLGASLSHIPIFPAQLQHKASMSGYFDFNVNTDDISNADDINNLMDDFDPVQNDPVYSDGEKQLVFRPFKFGVDAVFRPIPGSRLVSLIPEAALVFNGVYDRAVYVDFGLTAELNLLNILILDAGSKYEDLVWRERLGLILNFRVLEIGVGLTSQSQQFFKSFQGAGLGVDLGLRIGF